MKVNIPKTLTSEIGGVGSMCVCVCVGTLTHV